MSIYGLGLLKKFRICQHFLCRRSSKEIDVVRLSRVDGSFFGRREMNRREISNHLSLVIETILNTYSKFVMYNNYMCIRSHRFESTDCVKREEKHHH